MDYQKHYNLLIDKARDRELECYTESHHVIPRCLGGDDSRENIVNLTPEEHYIAHLLLVKIYPEHNGLVWAAVQMTGHPSGQRSSNRMYGWLKRKYQKVAKARTGEKNGSTGTMWINKIGTTENQKIRKDESIPYGWQNGRFIKRRIHCACGKRMYEENKHGKCKECFNLAMKNDEIRREPTTKLTDSQVLKIRYLYEEEGLSQIEIARKFNKYRKTISRIVKYKTRTNIGELAE